MSFIQVDELSYAYQGASRDVFHQFSLTMKKGETIGLLGPSGSGKSTLLRLLAGLEIPRTGKVSINDVTVVDDTTFVQPERRGVGMVFQDYALFPHMTVAQNIAFGLHTLSRSARQERMNEMLELVQLEGYTKRYPYELSGGQQQRVAFARAIAPEPQLLLMDEPFSSLDTDLKESIREELSGLLRKANMTAILVTHDRNDADVICDRIVTLEPLLQVTGTA